MVELKVQDYAKTAERLTFQLVRQLCFSKLTLASCESLTAGLVGAMICSISGASVCYLGGFITYSSELKATLVGVDETWIEQNGVINAEVAKQMAAGARNRCGADIAVSCTGVAGPDPQDGHQPGEVWVGLSTDEHTFAKRFDFAGSRDAIRWQTTICVLSIILVELGTKAL